MACTPKPPQHPRSLDPTYMYVSFVKALNSAAGNVPDRALVPNNLQHYVGKGSM